MSFFPYSCQYLFSDDQVMRMRAALMMFRPDLLESLGCASPCSTAVADFTPSNAVVSRGQLLTFTNTSSPYNATYSWTVEDHHFTSTNLSYTFYNLGQVEVCLRATYQGCVNEYCEFINVVPIDSCFHPELPECELLYNGEFSRNNVPIGVKSHFSPALPQSLHAYKVCNWINKGATPFFCSNLEKDVFGLRTDGEGLEETIATVMDVPFVDGENYTIAFEYLVGNSLPPEVTVTAPTLQIGLVPSTEYEDYDDAVILEELTDLWYDIDDTPNGQCFYFGMNFHYYEFTFHYTDDMGKHLFFKNNYTGFFPTPVEISNIYLRDISVPECLSCAAVPEFDFIIEDCSVYFEGRNLGDEALYYQWNFGDGTTSTSQNITHEYLFPGTFNVCLTIPCSSELSATECKQVVIPGPCTSCIELDDVTVNACSTSESSLNTYIANFSVAIPDGYHVCEGSELFFHSDDVRIEVSSYEIKDNSPDDLLLVGLVITSPLGYDFNQQGAIGNFILCNKDDEPVCFTINFAAEVCDECIEAVVPSIATCNELLSDESTYVYDGSLEINVGPNFTYFDFVSSELGFVVLSASQSGSVWTIQYRITVSNLYFSSTNIILYFEFGSTILCVSSEIIVTEPCSDIPNDCIEEWDPKSVSELCTERGDYLGFPFYMQAPSNGYTICEGGLFGTIDGGGIVETVHAQIQGSKLTFSLNILMPSNYNTHQTYYLRIYLCDHNGDLVCYLFPLQFECLESFQEPIETRNTTQGYESVMFSLFPNPTFLSITIEYPKFDPSQSSYVGVMDLMGQKMINQQITGNISIVDVSKLSGGLYFVSLIRNGSALSTQKVVVLQ